jgi:hypothetical protein
MFILLINAGSLTKYSLFFPLVYVSTRPSMLLNKDFGRQLPARLAFSRQEEPVCKSGKACLPGVFLFIPI